MSEQARRLHLVHLYPEEMNIYGDTGNRLVLQRRMEWRGIEVELSLVGVGQEVPASADILLGGGAQDESQNAIAGDLHEKAPVIRRLTDDGAVFLLICGTYQLFGRSYVTADDRPVKGIGVLPLETRAGSKRLVGNTLYDTPVGPVVGYENHNGLTYLDDKSLALGRVIRGAGNNGRDGTEGCLYKNIFGTYSHGPILSKNPNLADEIIKRALLRKYGAAELAALDDGLEQKAAAVARKRPR